MSKQYYTYVIIDQKPVDTRRYYIGYRGAKCCPAEDVKYMGSCDSLSMEIRKRPEDFKKVILAIHYNKFMAIWHENILQKAFDVVESPLFYNKSIQTTSGFCYEAHGKDHPLYGKPRPQYVKDASSLANKGRKHSDLFKQERSKRLKGEGNPMYGKRGELSPAYKRHVSQEERVSMRLRILGERNPSYRFDIDTSKAAELRLAGLSYKKIADILGCSATCIQKRLKKNA